MSTIKLRIFKTLQRKQAIQLLSAFKFKKPANVQSKLYMNHLWYMI